MSPPSSSCLGFLPSLPPQALQDLGGVSHWGQTFPCSSSLPKPTVPRAGLPWDCSPWIKSVGYRERRKSFLAGWAPLGQWCSLPRAGTGLGSVGWHRTNTSAGGTGRAGTSLTLTSASFISSPHSACAPPVCPELPGLGTLPWGTATGTELSTDRCDTHD